jgi:RNA polymerase sigma factor for flagellar operon FliA
MKLSKEKKEEFAIRYLPLVKYVMNRFYIRESGVISKEDLFNWGVIGLMEAIDRYDETKGVRFELYAINRIRGAIRDALRNEDTLTRRQREKFKMVSDVMSEFDIEDITDEKIAERLGLDIGKYYELLEEIHPITVSSIEELLEEKGQEFANGKNSIEEDIIEREQLEILARAISELDERERHILSLYYYEGLTLKQIGKVLGITESRVSQLHTQIILKLRRILENA